MEKRGPIIVALCLTPAVGMTNRNFLQTCIDINLSRSQRSNMIILLDSSYMVSYQCLLVTYGQFWLINDI